MTHTHWNEQFFMKIGKKSMPLKIIKLNFCPFNSLNKYDNNKISNNKINGPKN